MIRILADLGNSRLKWGKLRTSDGANVGWDEVALPPNDEAEWANVWERWGLANERSQWAISSVSPATLKSLERFLDRQGVTNLRVFRSGNDVPIRHELLHPETSGADRALAVCGALSLSGTEGRSGCVISCGSAITVERISSEGVWLGGAIAPGLALASETLHAKTAQLPRVFVTKAPAPLGRSTVPAIEAGIFWGCVGAIRELVNRQNEWGDTEPWIVWTGGDAEVLSNSVAFRSSRWMPGLVLLGLKAAVGW